MASLTFEELYQAVSELNKTDFDKFMAKIRVLSAKRKHAQWSEKEVSLLEEINQKLTSEKQVRFHELNDKKEQISLTEEERLELGKLVDSIERLHLNRITAIGKLAQLRKTSVHELIKELNLDPFPNA